MQNIFIQKTSQSSRITSPFLKEFSSDGPLPKIQHLLDCLNLDSCLVLIAIGKELIKTILRQDVNVEEMLAV
jgi:hypothetical protein